MLSMCDSVAETNTKIGKFRIRFMDSLVSALGDSLTPSVIRVSFQRAGLYNEFYRMRCLEQLPSRAEQAGLRGEMVGDCGGSEPELRLMTDREFVEQVMKRERRESPGKKVEKQAKRGGRGKAGKGGGEGDQSPATPSTPSTSTLHPSLTSTPLPPATPSTPSTSTLHPSLTSTPLPPATPSTPSTSTLHPSLTPLHSSALPQASLPKRLASVELADHFAELKRFKILHDDDDSNDSDTPPTSRRGRLLKPNTPWTPTMFRHLPPTTLW